jgi:cell division initiation protein
MKVTPLEIRQKTFERTLRGYDKDEVNAFLLSLSQEWERMQDEMKELRIKQETSDREVSKLREVESSLYKTLKTAEDTGANVIGQANKSAELLLREAQLKSESLLNESKAKAKNTIEEADMASRQMLADMEDRLKALSEQYKTFEQHRDNLLADLKRLAAETIDRVERASKINKSFDVEQHITLAKREAKRAVFPNSDFEHVSKRIVFTQTEETIEKSETLETVLAQTKITLADKDEKPEIKLKPMMAEEKLQKSFFDEFQ